MKRRNGRHGSRALALLALVCSSGALIAGGGRSKPGGFRGAPAEARSWSNPYEGRADAIQAGAKLFRRHCAECHGTDAGGGRRAPSLRSGAVRRATAGEVFWFLRNGDLRAGMPSWAGLPEERRCQLVAYLKAQQGI